MKNFFKCLIDRKIMIIIISLFCGLLALGFTYLIYNPRNEYYAISFSGDEIDESLFNDYLYIDNIKTEIEDIRDKSKCLVLNDYIITYSNIKEVSYDEKKEKITIIYLDEFKNEQTETEYGVLNDYDSDYINVSNYWYNVYNKEYVIDSINKLVKIIDENETFELSATSDGSVMYSVNYSSFSYIKSKKISKTSKLSYDNGIYTLKMQRRYFNTWQQARRFMLRSIKNSGSISGYLVDFNLINYTDASKSSSVINEVGGISIYIPFLISLGFGFILSVALVLIFYIIKKEDMLDSVEYDNENVFKTIFHKNYFKKCIEPFKDIKSVITMSILLALMLAAKFIHLPSGFGSLGISLGIFPFAVLGLLYGPVAGMLIGFVSNTVGFFLVPDGSPFHIGYGLNAALSGFIYGICFYKTKITYSKCLCARVIINLFINAFLGSLWWADVASLSRAGRITYMFSVSLPKNLVYLLPQSIMFYLTFKALSRVFRATGMVDETICDNMTLF